MDQLLTFYKEFLEAIGCEIDPDYNVLYRGEQVKVFVNRHERNLVLPIQSLVKNGNWNDLVAFHPGCESTIKGQSEVLNVIVALASNHLLKTMCDIIVDIIQLGLNKEVHNKLNLTQMNLLDKFEVIDPAIDKAVGGALLKTTGISGKNPFLSLKLSRGGEINSVKYSRLCSIIPHVLLSEGIYCGYKPTSIKADKALHTLFTLLFPEKLVYGSNSAELPYFTVFLDTYYNAITHLNKLIGDLGRYSRSTKIPTIWYDDVNNIAKYTKKYLDRSFIGNSGVSNKNVTHQEVNTPESVAAIAINSIPNFTNNQEAKSTSQVVQELNDQGLPLGIVKLGRAISNNPTETQAVMQQPIYPPQPIQSIQPPPQQQQQYVQQPQQPPPVGYQQQQPIYPQQPIQPPQVMYQQPQMPVNYPQQVPVGYQQPIYPQQQYVQQQYIPQSVNSIMHSIPPAPMNANRQPINIYPSNIGNTYVSPNQPNGLHWPYTDPNGSLYR